MRCFDRWWGVLLACVLATGPYGDIDCEVDLVELKSVLGRFTGSESFSSPNVVRGNVSARSSR